MIPGRRFKRKDSPRVVVITGASMAVEYPYGLESTDVTRFFNSQAEAVEHYKGRGYEEIPTGGSK